jgi:hypothetical protein
VHVTVLLSLILGVEFTLQTDLMDPKFYGFLTDSKVFARWVKYIISYILFYFPAFGVGKKQVVLAS